MNTESIYTAKDDETSIKDLILNFKNSISYVKSKWLVILLCGIIGSGLGFLLSKFKKTTYSATTTFVLEGGGDGGGKLGQYAGLASMAGIDIGSSGGGGIFQGDNILELYKSRKMIESTLLSVVNSDGKNQLLIDRYLDFNQLRESWSKYPALYHIQFVKNPSKVKNSELTRLQDSIINGVVLDINNNYLKVSKPDTKLNIIKVVVTSKNEVFSKMFNDELVKNVNDFYVQTKTKKSVANVNILQQKVDSVRKVMNGAIYSSSAIADATPNLNVTRQVQRAAPIQRSTFNAETNKTILAELVKNLEMSKMSMLSEAPLIQVVDQPVYPLEKEKLSFIKGIVLGFFIFSCLSVVVLLVKRVLKNLVD